MCKCAGRDVVLVHAGTPLLCRCRGKTPWPNFSSTTTRAMRELARACLRQGQSFSDRALVLLKTTATAYPKAIAQLCIKQLSAGASSCC